ncbi:hypothetical protein AX279_22500 [Pseudomonas sp. J237]|nr:MULTISPECIES: tape measure protein [Pseudomonas]OEO23098.1 hypothetical protein AX279_22500 [Pseudomonas sp. J237]
MSKVKTQLVIEGKNESKKAFDEVNQSLEGMNKQLAAASKLLVGALSLSALTGAIRSISETADSYSLMNARLKLATESQEEFNAAQVELQKIAQDTQAPIESLITLYSRISRPLKEAGRSQEDILKVTEAVATSFRISGASAVEAENGVIQFAQALGSGALRGDEFNSVAEQAPRLMQALADSIGVPVGALKDMAAQGELTAAVVTDALVSQLATLRGEAETLPETVGGAMVALSDQVNAAVGKADMQPLIDSLKKLGETFADPTTANNLAIIAAALVQLAAVAVDTAADVATVGDDLGYIAARIAGNVDEISRANKEIEVLKASANGFGILDLYMTDSQIARKLKEFEDYRAALLGQQSSMYGEIDALAQSAAEAAEKLRQDEIRDYTSYIGDLKKLQDDQLSEVKAKNKALEAEEKKAQQSLAKIRDDRLKIEQRYQEALSELGGSGDASYGAANALKVSAKQALANGDIATAQAQAQAALKMIQDLASAGENTYGFAGFIKELQGVELAANDIEQSNAEQKIASIKDQIAALAVEAEKLKDMPVSVKADDASIEAVRTQIQTLATELGNTEIVLPVRVSAPGTDVLGGVTGYAKGTNNATPGLHWVGENGPELMAFRGGEQVLTTAASNNLAARLSGMVIADRGLSLTDEQLAGAGSPKFPALGSVNLGMDGRNYEVFVTPSVADELRLAAFKRGGSSTKRR